MITVRAKEQKTFHPIELTIKIETQEDYDRLREDINSFNVYRGVLKQEKYAWGTFITIPPTDMESLKDVIDDIESQIRRF